MEDTLIIRAERTLPWLRRSFFGMYRWVPSGLVVIGLSAVVVLGLCAFARGPNYLLNWVPGIVYVGVLLLFLVPRHLALAKKLHTMAEQKGPPVFIATRERIRCEFDGNATDLRWGTVHSLCISPRTVYVFVNRRCAWFIPRGPHEDQLVAFARAANVRIREASTT